MKRSTLSQGIGFTFLYLSMIIALISVGAILFFITKNGIKIISWEFLTGVPRRAMTQGGIAPALVGTFYLTMGAILFALPFGVASAVFLTEYSPNSVVVNIIRMSINNLAGVPSVVFGLFGLSIFEKNVFFVVKYQRFNEFTEPKISVCISFLNVLNTPNLICPYLQKNILVSKYLVFRISEI